MTTSDKKEGKGRGGTGEERPSREEESSKQAFNERSMQAPNCNEASKHLWR